jgi:putative ABC transport system permease protein
MLIKMAVRNIFKYRRRSMVIFVAIIFSIFVLVLAMGFIEGFKEMFNRVIFENIGHIIIYKEGYYKKSEMLPITLLIQKPDEIIEEIGKVGGIKRINQELKFGSMIMAGDESLDIIARGVDILNPESSSRYRKSVVQGRFPEEDNQVILGKPLGEMLKVSVNDKIVAITSNPYGGINAVELIISGLFETGIKEEDENFMFMGLNKARDLLQIKDGVSEISLMLENHELTSDIIAQLEALIKEHHLEIFSWRHTYKELHLMFSIASIFELIMVFIVLIVVSTGIINTVLMSVFERIRDIGTMRAIGMRKVQVLSIILIEAGILGFFASTAGIIAGGSLVILLSKSGINMGEAAEQVMGMSRIIYPRFTLSTLALSFMVGILISVLGALYPGLLVVRLRPVEALHHH